MATMPKYTPNHGPESTMPWPTTIAAPNIGTAPHMLNPLATIEQLGRRLINSPIPLDLLDAAFIATQSLTQAACLLLELPHDTSVRAGVLLARYWIEESPMAAEFSDVSAAAIYIVTKLGPSFRTPRDIIAVFSYLLSPGAPFMRAPPSDARSGSPSAPAGLPSDHPDESDYYALHQRLLALEARILAAISFDCRVAIPYTLAITYLQALDYFGQPAESADGVARRALRLLNSALLSPQQLYLTHQPHALATAAIYGAARDAGAKMPDCDWWEVFDVQREDLGFLLVGMRSVEGYMKKLRVDVDGFGTDGMLTRDAVRREMSRRGLRHVASGGCQSGGPEGGEGEQPRGGQPPGEGQ